MAFRQIPRMPASTSRLSMVDGHRLPAWNCRSIKCFSWWSKTNLSWKQDDSRFWSCHFHSFPDWLPHETPTHAIVVLTHVREKKHAVNVIRTSNSHNIKLGMVLYIPCGFSMPNVDCRSCILDGFGLPVVDHLEAYPLVSLFRNSVTLSHLLISIQNSVLPW